MADTQTRAAVMATRRQNGGLPTMAQGHGAYKLKDDETHADQNEELTPAEIERYTIGKGVLEELCDSAVARTGDVERTADELRHWCKVAAQVLPANGQARLAISQLALTKSITETRTVVLELIRFVNLFLKPWNQKMSIISHMLMAYDSAKEDKRRMLHRLQLMSTRLERYEESTLLDHWERCFVALQKRRAHGRRWEYVINSFRTRETKARREGRFLLDDDSDGDSDSDDEGDPLPLKPQPTQVRLPSKEPGPESVKDSEEVQALKSQVEYLQAMLDIPLQDNVGVQTDISGETAIPDGADSDRFNRVRHDSFDAEESWGDVDHRSPTPDSHILAFKRLSAGTNAGTMAATAEESSSSKRNSTTEAAPSGNTGTHATAKSPKSSAKKGSPPKNLVLTALPTDVFSVRAIDATGWAGVVPGNLICSAKLVCSTEVANSQTNATVDLVRDRVVFDELDELLLFTGVADDTLEVSLTRKIGAPPMATCKIRLSKLLEMRADTASQKAMNETCTATIEVGITYSLQLEVTPAYTAFRTEALEDATIELSHMEKVAKPVLRFKAGWENEASREDRAQAQRERAREDQAQAQRDQAQAQRERAREDQARAEPSAAQAQRERAREDQARAEPSTARREGGSVSSRRTSRLNAAMRDSAGGIQEPERRRESTLEQAGGTESILEQAPPDDDTNVFGSAGFLFDPNDEDLASAKFSMKEVVVLAMLHEKQMQAAAQAHAEELHAMRESLQAPVRPPTPVRSPTPPPPPLALNTVAPVPPPRVDTACQTEDCGETIRIVEKIVEVEKRILVYPTEGAQGVKPVVNQPVRDPLYLFECPDEFFARLNWFAAKKFTNTHKVSDETRELRDRVLGAQMDAVNISFGVSSDSDLDYETTIPAAHLPTPTGQFWSSRAASTFHPTRSDPDNIYASDTLRRTQPPTVFALKALDLPPLRPSGADGSLKTLNLSDVAITRDTDPSERVAPRRIPPSRHNTLRPLVETEPLRPLTPDTVQTFTSKKF